VVLGANPLLRLSRGRAMAMGTLVLALGGCLTWYALTQNWHGWNGFEAPIRDILDNLSYIPLVIGVIAIFLALLRLVGFRPFNRAELTCVFAAMMVTAGIATFGLTEQLIPLIATPFNPEWNTPDRGWGDPLLLRLRRELYIHNPESIAMFRRGMPAPANLGWAAYLAHCKMVFFQIPWGEWIKPLGYWLIMVSGCYGLFYCLTYVVLGYWSDREKLIFPLAKLSESLLPEEKDSGRVPALLRGSGFWLGFAVSFLILAWNAAAEVRWVSGGLGPITLGMKAGPVAALVSGGPLEGLVGGESSLSFMIIFTAIGISFLLPLEISFSAWFYFLVGKAVIFAHCWLGYGRNGNDYHSDWLWLNNPVSAQGGGGLMVFSAVSLYRCLKDYARLAAGRTIGDRGRRGLPVIGLAFFMLVVTLWVTWNRIGFFWALAFVVVLTLLTIGLMRIVAEGGIYWFQSNTSFFHIYKMLGLGKYLAPSLLGPLIPIYSVLFLDTKTFLAPNVLNAAAMNKSVGGGGRGGRIKFHLSILLSILVSVVVSLGFAIFLAHLRGAQQEHAWFYSAGPSMLMDTARDASKAVSDFNGVTTFWYVFGACWVALSLYLRTWLFWFPHPIGYILLINQLMGQLWFSFFLGWVCKKIAVGYGGKATFEKIREFFLGLIMGELTAIVVAMAISMLVRGVAIGGITLNRY